jgi:hypothetical protein
MTLTPPPDKPCTKCGDTKPLEDFHACSSAKDGKTRWCKLCFIQHWKDQSAATMAQRLARKAEREAVIAGRRLAKEASRAMVDVLEGWS